MSELVPEGRIVRLRTAITKDEDGWQLMLEYHYENGVVEQKFACPEGQEAFSSEEEALDACLKYSASLRVELGLPPMEAQNG